jgi:opacity protein-like surface antigen
MKRMLKNVVLVGSVMAAGIAAADFGGDWSPIVGIDYKWSTARHSNQGFGGSNGRNKGGASVYLGSRFCENFGLELGYDWSSRRSNTFTGTVAGVPYKTKNVRNE